ncbi:uncharacterized protein LOC128551557 [Mercenaria mercenaria]|uniref:uncharacterized protein LOC128551557 n=1 Tax=Mercenaria mercenaria TaxID=6596 RepID=UPI00234EEB67|nr:uncharacterized protein LOC128551557 [Mercenaria mercenaria]
MKRFLVIFGQISLLSHFPTILTISLPFSPLWLIESDGTKRGLINQQLKDSQTLDYNVDVLDGTTLGLLILAIVLLWIHGIIFTAFGCMLVKRMLVMRRTPSGLCNKVFIKCVHVSIGLYIIASFVMLTACARFAAIFPMEKISYAFYVTMTIFCYIWLVVLIFICDHICKRRRDENVFHTLVCGLREYNDDFI